MLTTFSRIYILKYLTIRALDKELSMKKKLQRCKLSVKKGTSNKKEKDYLKTIERVSRKITKYLLAIKRIREKHEHIDTKVSDEDRVVINEAIRQKFHPIYIIHLINKHMKVFETKGAVENIDHPIHVACSHNKEVVRYILEAYPDCMSQENENGKLPLEVFVAGIDPSSLEYGDAVDLFASSNVDSFRKLLSENESLREQVFSNTFVPQHLKHSVDFNLEPRQMEISSIVVVKRAGDQEFNHPSTSKPFSMCNSFLCFERN